MKKKTIIALVVILLAIALVVAGIMAYFTSTDSATNVFTIGNVKIDLTEPNWDTARGTFDQPEAARNMVPGGMVAKDPKVTNIGTNDAFVFLKVEIPCYTVGEGTAATTVDLFSTQYNNGTAMTNGVNPAWKPVGDSISGNVHTYVYAYATGTEKADLTALVKDAVTPALFDQVTLTTNTAVAEAAVATNTTDANRTIAINAYGIQTTEVTQGTQLAIFNLFDSNFTPAP